MTVISYLPNRGESPPNRTLDRHQHTPLLSVVIPFFNEENVLEACHDRVCLALDQLGEPVKSFMSMTAVQTTALPWLTRFSPATIMFQHFISAVILVKRRR